MKRPSYVKEKQLYRETYYKGAIQLGKDYLPILRHACRETSELFVAVECHMLAAGSVKRSDGTLLDYQDMRIYLETPQS